MDKLLTDNILKTIRASGRYLSARQIADKICEDQEMVQAGLEVLEADNKAERRGRHVWGLVGEDFSRDQNTVTIIPEEKSSASSPTSIAAKAVAKTVTTPKAEPKTETPLPEPEMTTPATPKVKTLDDVLNRMEQRLSTPRIPLDNVKDKSMALHRLAGMTEEPLSSLLLDIRDDLQRRSVGA